MPYAGRGLTQNADNCFIHFGTIAGQQTAMQMVGQIYRQPTGGRASPPICLSGFDTGGTPFAFGHVMGLELGGCDTSENIVPQYGQWQGNQIGDWRRMEVAVSNAAANADVFIADMTYGAGGFVETYEQQCTRFHAGDKLFHWTEPRIPIRFRVWTVANNWVAGGGVSIAAYMGADAGGKDARIGALIGALPDARKVFDQTINAMPDVDRGYWRKQMLNKFARAEHRKYERLIELENRRRELARDRLLSTAGGGRKSGRLAVKDPANHMAKEVVSMDLAKWLNSDKEMQKLVARLQDTTNPNSAVTGWTNLEVTQLTVASLNAAVFAI
jgi:hypothetical protein